MVRFFLAAFMFVFSGCASYPPLIQAAHDGDIHRMEALVKGGSNVNMKGGRWEETALMAAAAQGHLDTVKWLLDHGADINLPSKYGDNALITATWGCHRDVAMFLVTHGIKVNVQNVTFGSSPLMLAVECVDIDLVKFLLENGADVSAKYNSGMTSLITAIWHNNDKIAEVLINAGVNIDAAYDGGGSPLYEASAKGADAIVALLIAKGADVNYISDYYLWTPLMVSTAENRFPIVSMLLGAGAKIDAKDQRGYTPLMIAANNGSASIVKILCERGADVNMQGENGWTALQLASYYRFENVVAILLMHNASVDTLNKDGHDALWYAKKGKNNQIIQMLENPKAELIAAVAENVNPASDAIQEGRMDMATMELVRTAVPLKVGYDNIVINRFETSENFKKDYSEAIETCRQKIIDHLQHKKVYKEVTANTNSPHHGRTVLVDGFVEDIYYSSTGARIAFGPLAGTPYMSVRIKLTDADSKKVIHETVISADTNGWFAGVTMGLMDRTLSSKMGELIGEYLYTIIPAN